MTWQLHDELAGILVAAGDVPAAMAQLEAAVAGQVALGGADTATEQAAELLLAALEPALRQSVLSLAEHQFWRL